MKPVSSFSSSIQNLLIRTGGATVGMHFLRLPTNYTTHSSGVVEHISRAELFANVQTMHYLFTTFGVHVLLHILQ